MVPSPSTCHKTRNGQLLCGCWRIWPNVNFKLTWSPTTLFGRCVFCSDRCYTFCKNHPQNSGDSSDSKGQMVWPIGSMFFWGCDQLVWWPVAASSSVVAPHAGDGRSGSIHVKHGFQNLDKREKDGTRTYSSKKLWKLAEPSFFGNPTVPTIFWWERWGQAGALHHHQLQRGHQCKSLALGFELVAPSARRQPTWSGWYRVVIKWPAMISSCWHLLTRVILNILDDSVNHQPVWDLGALTPIEGDGASGQTKDVWTCFKWNVSKSVKKPAF